MRQKVAKVDARKVSSATFFSIRKKELIFNSALEASADADIVLRLESQFCISCYYLSSSLAGQAFTTRPCGICEVDVIYGSTYTDVLCLKCAIENHLCKHCAGDINMNPCRKYEVKSEI